MTGFADIERRRAALGITRSRLCAAAGVGRSTYREAQAGIKHPVVSTIARLNTALNRFRLGVGVEAGELAPAAAFRICIVASAFWLNADPKSALASVPSRRATASPEWQRAAEVRRAAFWLANNMLGFRIADLARAAGVSKHAVSDALKELEDRRDHDAALDRVLTQMEEVLT
jgi:transcriptional regulator with XRE-family HTH domain